jgi:hypothetical protein
VTRRLGSTLLALWVYAPCLLTLAACSHASSSGAAADAGADAAASRPATNHRPSETTCAPTPVPAEPQIPDGGISSFDQCARNEDCNQKPNGRCIVAASSARATCFYDQCMGDRDCMPSQVCGCTPQTTPVNICIQAECYIDADCGASGYCSPSIACGGVVGYYCHVAADECVNDPDCTGVPCSYDIGAAHWACVNKTCSNK